jgi:hypothetical protein
MMSKYALVFYYTRYNRYSYHALAGALETDAFFDDLEIYFPDNEKTLVEQLPDIVKKHRKVVIAVSFMTPQLWRIASLVKKFADDTGNTSRSSREAPTLPETSKQRCIWVLMLWRGAKAKP